MQAHFTQKQEADIYGLLKNAIYSRNDICNATMPASTNLFLKAGRPFIHYRKRPTEKKIPDFFSYSFPLLCLIRILLQLQSSHKMQCIKEKMFSAYFSTLLPSTAFAFSSSSYIFCNQSKVGEAFLQKEVAGNEFKMLMPPFLHFFSPASNPIEHQEEADHVVVTSKWHLAQKCIYPNIKVLPASKGFTATGHHQQCLLLQLNCAPGWCDV